MASARGTALFFGAGLNYANGPINLDLVFQQRSGVATNPVTTTPRHDGTTQDNINGGPCWVRMTFKVVKVFGSYQSQDDNNGTSAREGSNKTWQVGANIPVFGNGSIQASYAKLSWDRTGAGDNTAWALGYRHALEAHHAVRPTPSSTTTTMRRPPRAICRRPVRSAKRTPMFTAGLNHAF